MKAGSWHGGNQVALLENGEQFFPRAFEAMREAKEEILVETFIVDDDQVGRELQRALIDAAARGVRATLTMDGYGCGQLSPEFIKAMVDAGVRVHLFDPKPTFLGWRTNIFRRLHRKLVVVDGRRAFVGGINFTATQLCETRDDDGRQDYAVEVTGPMVRDVQVVAHEAVGDRPPPERRIAAAGTTRALFVTRDNDRHQNDIETHYRIAIRAARESIIIANAYFFPGYRLIRDLCAAAERGVQVQLVMQGDPDMPIVHWLTTILYEDLRRSGIEIHEYTQYPLHAKVAVIDDEWATVGSSNLDPLSLFLNLEANVVVRDRAFATRLGKHLERLIERDCEPARIDTRKPRLWRRLLSAVAFHVARRFPRLAGWMPGRRVTTAQRAVPDAG
jgi:cardiolipin synthase A/B